MKYIFIIIFIISPILSKEINVCSNCELRSITESLEISLPGDQIIIKEGIYKEGQINITKSISLLGEGKVIIDGEKKKNVLLINSNNVRIQNLIIINSGSSELIEYAGIYVNNSSGCEILDNQLIDNIYGIYLAKSGNCIISGNIIKSFESREVYSGNGIHLWYSENTIIKNNKIQKHRDGFYFEFAKNTKLEENESNLNYRYGMHFMFCNGAIINKNTFDKNLTGVAIMYSDHLNVTDNLFIHQMKSSSGGILMKEINYSNFKKNKINSHTEGIILDSSTQNKFIGNDFNFNGIALKIYGNSEKNEFRYNNFFNNYFDVSTNTKDNRNLYLNNYFDKYTGYDLDKDGYGDIPYRPVKAFSYWINKYIELTVLINSPIVTFIDLAEKAFPSLSPVDLMDEKPIFGSVNDNSK